MISISKLINSSLTAIIVSVPLFILPTAIFAAPQPSASDFTSARICGTCHVAIYKGWKGSMHANAVSDPIFNKTMLIASRETAGKSDALCLSCHAPTTHITRDFQLNNPLTKEGVTCDFCHRVKGVDLYSNGRFEMEAGNKKWGPLKGVQSPAHESGYSELFEKSEFCGSCHEYTNEHGAAILETYSEWKKSPQAKVGITCQTCHMPKIKGLIIPPSVKIIRETYINSHEAAGGHSVETVGKAISLKIGEVKRSGEKVSVVVHIENVGSGHAVPTGIPTRKLVLKFQGSLGGTPIYTEERVFQKVLLDDTGKIITKDADVFLKARKVKEDTRLKPGQVRNENFTFIAPKDKPVEVEASVHYVYQPGIKGIEMNFELHREKSGLSANSR